MLGLAQGAFDKAVPYTYQRQQFGQPVGTFQGMAFQIAQAATEIEAARLLTYNAARRKEEGKPFAKEAAMAKLYASNVAQRVAGGAIEWAGGVGFTRETGIEKFWRDSKIVSLVILFGGISVLTSPSLGCHLRGDVEYTATNYCEVYPKGVLMNDSPRGVSVYVRTWMSLDCTVDPDAYVLTILTWLELVHSRCAFAMGFDNGIYLHLPAQRQVLRSASLIEFSFQIGNRLCCNQILQPTHPLCEQRCVIRLSTAFYGNAMFTI